MNIVNIEKAIYKRIQSELAGIVDVVYPRQTPSKGSETWVSINIQGGERLGSNSEEYHIAYILYLTITSNSDNLYICSTVETVLRRSFERICIEYEGLQISFYDGKKIDLPRLDINTAAFDGYTIKFPFTIYGV